MKELQDQANQANLDRYNEGRALLGLDAPDAWHPLDTLYAPLYSSSGELLGNMSVDLPPDYKIPDHQGRELLGGHLCEYDSVRRRRRIQDLDTQLL